jgi:hypothetical protein
MDAPAIFRLILVAIFVALLFQGSVIEALIEAMNNFWGGGPPTPRHPLPADDNVIVRRKRSRASRPFYRFW